MPFGKHEGRVLADLPGHCLNWFAREGFPKGGSWVAPVGFTAVAQVPGLLLA